MNLNTKDQLSGYNLMWVLIMFDLPTNTKKEKRAAAKFRKDLLTMGFSMSQFSVYSRFCIGQHQVGSLAEKIKLIIPEEGEVNLISFTDKQYARMLTFRNGLLKTGECNPPEMFQIY